MIDEAAILEGLPYDWKVKAKFPLTFVYSKDESRPETWSVYKVQSKSLKVTDFFELVTTGIKLVYNEVC